MNDFEDYRLCFAREKILKGVFDWKIVAVLVL